MTPRSIQTLVCDDECARCQARPETMAADRWACKLEGEVCCPYSLREDVCGERWSWRDGDRRSCSGCQTLLISDVSESYLPEPVRKIWSNLICSLLRLNNFNLYKIWSIYQLLCYLLYISVGAILP